MKSKIKCHSRSVMAVVLAISMLISTMMVGLIATDAARVAEGNTVGATSDNDSVGTSNIIPAGTYFVYYDAYPWYMDNSVGRVDLLDDSDNIVADGQLIEMVKFNTSAHYAFFNVPETVTTATKFRCNRYYNNTRNNLSNTLSYDGSSNTLVVSGSSEPNNIAFASLNYYPTLNMFGKIDGNGSWSGTGMPMTFDHMDANYYYYKRTTSGTDIRFRLSYNNSNYDASSTSSAKVALTTSYQTAIRQGTNNSYYSLESESSKEYIIWARAKAEKEGGEISVMYQPPTYTITLANDGHGTASSTSTLENLNGSNTIDLSASPAAGYEFDKWVVENGSGVTFDNENSDSTNATVTAEATIKATFKETLHTVGVAVGASSGGHVEDASDATISGTNIQVGAVNPVTIKAVPDNHYHFDNWTSTGGVTLGSGGTTTANDTITASADGTITANFEEDTKYTVTANGCTASTASTYAGETVTLTPSVPSGKLIDQVTVLGGNSQEIPYQVSGDNYTFEMPASNVTATITYRNPATINVTASSDDSAKGSAAASPSGSVTEGTLIAFTATPKTGKTFDKWIVTENNSTRTVTDAQFSQIAGRYNINAVAYFNDGYTVNVNIDDSTHGVVEGVSHEVAAAGQEITVTWNTKFGWTYGELWDVTNDQEVTPTSHSNTEIKFNMPSASVNYQIKTKTTISTSATWKYYGYKKSSEKLEAITDFDGNAFSESYLNGDTTLNFAYYKVSGRTDNDGEQAFGVRNTAAAADVNTIFLEIPSGWSSKYYASFKNSSGKYLTSTGEAKDSDQKLEMTDTRYDVNGNDVYAIVVPPGAVKVKFYDNNSIHYSDRMNLSTSSNYFYKNNSWGQSTNSNFPSNTGGMYLWKNYKGHDSRNVYGDKQFGSNLMITNHSFTYYLPDGHEGTDLTVPKVYLPDEVRGMDYYIIVYYPGKNYGTLNGVEVDTRNLDHPVIVAQTFLPGEKVDPVVVTNVKVIAKDGAVRRYGASRNPGSDQDYSTFEKHADTYLTDESYNTPAPYTTQRKGYGTSQTTYDYASKVEKGSTIYFKTTVDANKRDTYYVKAFSINGVVYSVNDNPGTGNNGVYTGSFTIPTDYDRDYVEITPIYYLVNPGDTVRFSVQGYDDSVMNSGWGNTLYVYPYWEGLSKDNNGFGGYPGQPMIFYKGEYYIDIPVTYSGKTVKGMTLNNGYWDDIHYKVVGEVSKHHQTYDYDDFYKIYKEYPDLGSGVSRRIICSFKFRTKKNNDEPSNITPSNYNSTNGNGWEVLTNYEGIPVDIYGKELNNKTVADVEALGDNVVHIVSQDYKKNCAGHYATEWAVYNSSNSKVSRIVPSALVINEDNIKNGSSNLTKAQVEEYMKKTYGSSTAKFAEEYVALEGLRDQPAMITYEKSIWGGDDPAERCDARWYWSYTSAKVNANMRVAYSNDGGASFNLDGTDPLTEGATAPTTGATVSFGSDKSTKSHVLTNQPIDTPVALSADQNTTNYTFVGWYAIREGVAQFVGTDPSQSNIPLTSNVTFEARYVRTTKGYFTIGHLVHPASTGTGTVEISAKLMTNGTQTEEKITTNGSVDFSGLTYGGKQTIEVTLSSTPTGISSFEDFYATLSDLLSGYNADYISNLVIDTNGGTKIATFTITVDKLFKVVDQTNITQSITSMTNYSKFGVEDIDLDVNIVFTFPVRYYPNKNYEIKHVTITKDERLLYFPNATDITDLTAAYVMSKAPYESIYRKDFEWGTPSINGLNATVEGTATDKPTVTAVVDDGSGQTRPYIAPYLGNFEEANSTTINHVNKESENLYFQQWNVYKLDEQYYTGKTPVAICFSENFNYAGFEDYYVEAVYGPTQVENRHALVSGLTTNVSLLNITRSHWNNTLDGDADSGSLYNSPDTEYDRIYVDFVLSYANEGKLVNEDSKTFGYNLTYVDGSTKKTISKTIDRTKADEKNRVEVALGIENLRGNASPTRSYTITPTIDGSEVGSASQSFCLYEVAFPQAAWAK